jgi:replicative DNA helicase
MNSNKITQGSEVTSDSNDLTLSRKLPSNIQAEQMLLGAILINPDLLNHVSEFLKADHFFEMLHQKIYYSIEVINEKNLTVTPITLKSMLEREESFKQQGGIDYLNKITTLAMMVINPRDYGRIIYDLALKRELIKAGENIVNSAYDSSIEHDANKQIEQAENILYNLATKGIGEKGFVQIKDPISESLVSINRAIKNADHVIGISTGLIELDMTLSGFHNSDLVIIAARPSMGKTAFSLNLAINACNSLKLKNQNSENPMSVGFFSLEMSSEQLASRILSMHTGIDSSDLRSGNVREERYNTLRKAASELTELPFFVDDTPALSISAIRTRARKLKRKHNLGILFIDYLQLITGANHYDSRVREVTEITQSLKAIAKELNIPVIALSQLSRAVELREDKRPMLSDLRESGSIEQDADIVMFIHREEYYLSRKEPSPGDEKYMEWQANLSKVHNIADIIIAKHRNGPVRNLQIFYDNRYSRFGNLQKHLPQ